MTILILRKEVPRSTLPHLPQAITLFPPIQLYSHSVHTTLAIAVSPTFVVLLTEASV
jgi:hypothetical protein